MATKNDFEVKYQHKNPKMKGKEAEGKISWRLYEKFKKIITSYVDDCTVAVMDDKAWDELMSEMRERYEIKEGEGQPTNYLLGILIKQDLEAGTVTLTQELAATKLADAFLTEEEKVKASSVNHPMLHSVVLPRLKEK